MNKQVTNVNNIGLQVKKKFTENLEFFPLQFIVFLLYFSMVRKIPFPIFDVIVKSRNKTAKKKDPDARRANPEE